MTWEHSKKSKTREQIIFTHIIKEQAKTIENRDFCIKFKIWSRLSIYLAKFVDNPPNFEKL